MVRLLLLFIATLVASSIDATPSYAQGCGTHTVYGQVLCRDYKGRSVSRSHCDRYTSEIGPRPTVPRRQCPNPCCTEKHTVDGVVVDSEVKVAGSCNSTSYTTTCEEHDNCPAEKEPKVISSSGGGGSYTAWGRTTCATGWSVAYTGQAMFPISGHKSTSNTSIGSAICGVEINETFGVFGRTGWSNGDSAYGLGYQSISCAVCVK